MDAMLVTPGWQCLDWAKLSTEVPLIWEVNARQGLSLLCNVALQGQVKSHQPWSSPFHCNIAGKGLSASWYPSPNPNPALSRQLTFKCYTTEQADSLQPFVLHCYFFSFIWELRDSQLLLTICPPHSIKSWNSPSPKSFKCQFSGLLKNVWKTSLYFGIPDVYQNHNLELPNFAF